MLDVLGCRIHVNDTGTGAPILFLHGNPDSSALWAPIAASLSASHRCIVPDLPGFGRSTAPPSFDYSLDGMALFLDALYSALQLKEPMHLVGHDFGGIFAAAWIATAPGRVRSFTVSNAAFTASYHWHVWAWIWRTPVFGEISMRLTNRWNFGWVLRRASPKLTQEHIDATYALLTPAVRRTVLRLYRAVRQQSFVGWEERYRDAARELSVLVLWGEDDPYMPESVAETFGAQRIVRIPGAGHWLPAVEPRRTAEEIARFIGALPNRET